jgi:protein SMG6
MTTLHPFTTSRESILPLFSPQSAAAAASASAAAPKPTSALKSLTKDQFVQLHGMLFTYIQLDDFAPTLERFIERLERNETREPTPQRELEERDWIMMAIINIGAVLEYGREGVVKKLGGLGAQQVQAGHHHHHHPGQIPGQVQHGLSAQQMMMQQQQQQAVMRVMAKKVAAGVLGSMMPASASYVGMRGEEMDVDMDGVHPSSTSSLTDQPTLPLPLTLALTLTFRMLAVVLRNPTRQATPFAQAELNPYLTTESEDDSQEVKVL